MEESVILQKLFERARINELIFKKVRKNFYIVFYKSGRLIKEILTIIINAIVSPFSGKPKGKPSLVTEEEIRALIKIGEEEDILHKEKYKMLSKVFEFSDRVVKQVMTPKDKIVYVCEVDPANYKESALPNIVLFYAPDESFLKSLNCSDGSYFIHMYGRLIGTVCKRQ